MPAGRNWKKKSASVIRLTIMSSPPTARDFFISRAGADAAWAKWIARVLREEGFTTFVQDEDFIAGRSFLDHMNDGVKLERTIALFSPDYFQSAFTKREWQAALAQGPERLLTVLLRACEIPPLLADIVYINLVGTDEAQARERLVNGVKGLPTSGGPAPFPGAPAPFPGPHQISIAKLPTVNPLLIGREAELKQLDEAWTNPQTNLVSIAAFGGVGKTSLAINWWHRNQAPGAKRILGWSFYSQGAAEDRQASAEPFLDHALREWFGVTNPPIDSWARGEKLAELIRRERTLIILDGLEPIQFPPGPQIGHFKDPGMEALLRELSIHNPGLCVCTSRLFLTDLDGPGILPIDLDDLTPQSGGEYLKALDVKGPSEELQKASMEFENNALALTLLGNLLKRYRGDIYKRDTIPSLFAEPKKGGHARRTMRQYEHLFEDKPELDVLRILGLFDRPADKGALKILRKLSPGAWAEALENLQEARLIEYEDLDGPLDCHPLIREHFAEEYRASKPGEFRAAQSQLYEYYSNQAPDLPDTLENMTPLFYAVYHGCQAGKHEETRRTVYFNRIRRGKEAFLIRRLGAHGVNLSLLSNFFITAWSEPVPSLPASDQTWVTAGAAFALGALGRLREAVGPTQAAVEARLGQEDWTNAAIQLGNLSELQLTLGDVHEAIDAARRSVKMADRSGDEFHRFARRANLAGALHQSGDAAAALALFQEAEKMQAEWQPEYPILYSIRGSQFCDLLLAQGEFKEVFRRSTQLLAWRTESDSLLDIALEHLSLGRAHAPGSVDATRHLDEAVSLRSAGTLVFLPPGLLARAAHFRHTCEWNKAQHDLDEVRVLANRCGMRLFLTDYHLEQARLLIVQGKQEDARPHYEAAEKLIEETGYRRRDPELAELKTQLSAPA
jgi:tetratricopeptide (TPR) repeat protein